MERIIGIITDAAPHPDRKLPDKFFFNVVSELFQQRIQQHFLDIFFRLQIFPVELGIQRRIWQFVQIKARIPLLDHAFQSLIFLTSHRFSVYPLHVRLDQRLFSPDRIMQQSVEIEIRNFDRMTQIHFPRIVMERIIESRQHRPPYTANPAEGSRFIDKNNIPRKHFLIPLPCSNF